VAGRSSKDDEDSSKENAKEDVRKEAVRKEERG
jgi:hypothetical protein